MKAQTQRLKEYLEAGNKCDPLTAWTELGIYNYSARLTEVKRLLKTESLIVRKSAEIKSEWKEVKNQFGEKVKVKQHWIEL